MAQLDATNKLMGALLRMKPKPHEEMKVGKKKTIKVSAKKRAFSKPKTAWTPASCERS
jgi:hypothetical protein